MDSLATAVIAFLGVLVGAAIAFIGELLKIEERRKERILLAWQEWFSASDDVLGAEHLCLQYVLFGRSLFPSQDEGMRVMQQAHFQLERAQRRESSAFALVMLVEELEELVVEAQRIRQQKPLVELQPRVNRQETPSEIHDDFLRQEELIARQRGHLAVRAGDRSKPFWVRMWKRKRAPRQP